MFRLMRRNNDIADNFVYGNEMTAICAPRSLTFLLQICTQVNCTSISGLSQHIAHTIAMKIWRGHFDCGNMNRHCVGTPKPMREGRRRKSEHERQSILWS